MTIKRISSIQDQIKIEHLEAENEELQNAVVELAQLLAEQDDALVEIAESLMEE